MFGRVVAPPKTALALTCSSEEVTFQNEPKPEALDKCLAKRLLFF
jgi:hypothetical protein